MSGVHSANARLQVLDRQGGDWVVVPVEFVLSVVSAEFEKTADQLTCGEMLVVLQIENHLVTRHLFEVDEVVHWCRLVSKASALEALLNFHVRGASILSWKGKMEAIGRRESLLLLDVDALLGHAGREAKDGRGNKTALVR